MSAIHRAMLRHWAACERDAARHAETHEQAQEHLRMAKAFERRAEEP
jgi:hypothetical protein